MQKTLLLFGYGYSAQAVAPLALQAGWTVIGTTRKAEVATKMQALGITARLLPDHDLTPDLQAATHLLTSAGPGDAGDPLLTHYDLSGQNFEWVGYLSTTGVYGDHQGGWVDENTSLTPSTRRGKWRVAAEAAWQTQDLPLHIFRLAGIYGPGRGPFAKVRVGTARQIIKEGQVFSRIHVEDIASAVWASIHAPNPGAIYNLCDDDPAPPQDVLAYAAELLGQTLPPAVRFADADMTPMARSFYAESKRVRNDFAKADLGWAPKYPNYKAGLKALLTSASEGGG